MYQLAQSEDAGHYMLYTFFYYQQYPLSSELFDLKTVFVVDVWCVRVCVWWQFISSLRFSTLYCSVCDTQMDLPQ